MTSKSAHSIHMADSANLAFIDEESVALVVTSPPYPMIEMWDEQFSTRVSGVSEAFERWDGRKAFELMHEELDKVWAEVYRTLRQGGFACINIGDATRKIGDQFSLYPNHSRILAQCYRLGFDVLPAILWRKQTNAPNKFMGSGMLPAGAYVTLEHEYILILRKGQKREFVSPDEKLARRESAFFWEERNAWFSDIWDFKGARQTLDNRNGRDRSAAFPFELAYRLVNMYSCKSDLVLDPFLGTGTTMFAAMSSGRHSIGVELDESLLPIIYDGIRNFTGFVNGYLSERLQRHLDFCKNYEEKKGQLGHLNEKQGFPVVTSQEVDLRLEAISEINVVDHHHFKVTYQPLTMGHAPPRLLGSPTTSANGQLEIAY
jgi:modification methylase